MYLATKCENMPNAVWIWDMSTLLLNTILIHLNEVKSFKFSPNSQTLVIGTGQARVFVWTPKGACVIDLPRNEYSIQAPSELHVKRVLWNPLGANLVFTDTNVAILAFPQNELL